MPAVKGFCDLVSCFFALIRSFISVVRQMHSKWHCVHSQINDLVMSEYREQKSARIRNHESYREFSMGDSSKIDDEECKETIGKNTFSIAKADIKNE